MMLDTPMIGNIGEYCLASLVFHRSILESLPISHPLCSSSIFRLPVVCELETAGTHTKVLYPWSQQSMGCVFTGIPPHVALLQEVQGLQQLVLGLVDQFDKRLTIQQLDQRQINGGILGRPG